MDNEIYKKIVSKKEFSRLPRRDVELAFAHFEKRAVSEEEKIRLTRDLLHRVFASFVSQKILSPRNREAEWILRKHISTRERMGFYRQVYERLLKGFGGKINIIDLGCGINGVSFNYLGGRNINYIGVEAVGQLVDLTNRYFEKEKIPGRVFHESLFDLKKIKGLIKRQSGKKVVFLFKIVDCLEVIERDYSKKLLKGIASLADRIVVSFATRSLVSRRKFFVSRKWFFDFLNENFKVTDDFILSSERYMVFENKKF